jgi:hypothetical protein
VQTLVGALRLQRVMLRPQVAPASTLLAPPPPQPPAPEYLGHDSVFTPTPTTADQARGPRQARSREFTWEIVIRRKHQTAHTTNQGAVTVVPDPALNPAPGCEAGWMKVGCLWCECRGPRAGIWWETSSKSVKVEIYIGPLSKVLDDAHLYRPAPLTWRRPCSCRSGQPKPCTLSWTES